MSPLALLALAAAAASSAAPSDGRGVQVETAEVRAQIVRPVIVRQSSGWQQAPDAPVPQITRRGPTILVEFQ